MDVKYRFIKFLLYNITLASIVMNNRIGWCKDVQHVDGKEIPVITPNVSYSHKGRVELLAISPDGNSVATESTDGVKIADIKNGKVLQAWNERGFSANSLAFSNDGRILGTGNNDGWVRLWNTGTGTLLKKFRICQWSIYAITFSPDGQTLVSCAADGTVQLWNIEIDKRLMTLGGKGERMSAMVFSPDGKLLATLSRYVKTTVWDAATGRLVGTLAGKGVDFGSLCSILFCYQGKVVAVACDGDIRFWNPRENKEPKRLRIPDSIDPLKERNVGTFGPYSRLIFIGLTVLSHDAKKAATVNKDGSIAVWDIETRQVRQTLMGTRVVDLLGGGVETMIFTPDGKVLASGNRNGEVEVWQIE